MTTFEKTWQFDYNRRMDATSQTTTNKNAIWWVKGFLTGQTAKQTVGGVVQGDLTQGLWTVYQSNDGAGNFGSAGDGYDRWNTAGATTGNSGSAATITTGATITGAVRLTGLSGLTAASVGNFIGIQGAATAANNSAGGTSAASGTIGWRIVNFISSSSVDVYNPVAVTGDANNGSIQWNERNPPTYNTTNLVNAVGGSNHSWMILKSPLALGPHYLIIDYNSTNNYFASLGFSKTAPTGGTATARPTAADEVMFAANYIVSNATTGNIVCGGLTTDGYFFFHTNRGNGTQNPETAVIWQIPAETKSADGYKAVMYFAGTQAGGGTGPFLQAQFATTANWATRNFNGATTSTGIVASIWTFSTTSAFATTMTLSDFADGQYDDLPVYLILTTLGQYSVKGRIYDFKWCPNSLPIGFTEPNPSSVQSIALGALWVPSNTALLV